MGVAARLREAYKQVNASKARARQRHQAGGESSLQSSSVVQTIDTNSESVPLGITTESLYPLNTGSTVKRNLSLRPPKGMVAVPKQTSFSQE
jgi:hypothetical protein